MARASNDPIVRAIPIPDTSSRKNHTYPEGRVCPHTLDDGSMCGTALSIYNSGPFCWKHTEVKPSRVGLPRSKRRVNNGKDLGETA